MKKNKTGIETGKRKGDGKKKNIVPYKSKTAQIYALWKSMPIVFHELPLTRLGQFGCDIDNDIFRRLAGCKNRTQFRKEFRVGKNSLTNWDRSEVVNKMVEDFNNQSNVLRYKKDIDFHFTQMTIKESDAARVKLWKQLFEGWEEKQTIRHKGLKDLLDEINDEKESPIKKDTSSQRKDNSGEAERESQKQEMAHEQSILDQERSRRKNKVQIKLGPEDTL